jgi:hypothetical protein
MTLNAAGDLRREVGKGQATATCLHRKYGGQCDFIVRNVWPAQAGRRARAHTRETGHITQVRYEHITEYLPGTTA